MVETTEGIVLRTVKYGETSLIATLFTRSFGVQAYLLQGVRNAGSKRNKTGLLQTAMLLELEAYHVPHRSLQRLRAYHPVYIFDTIAGEIAKNTIAVFSVEFLLRLLPPNAPAPEIFDFSFNYFLQLDQFASDEVLNFPLCLLVHCNRLMGYDVYGNYSAETPYLDIKEGGFSAMMPQQTGAATQEDGALLDQVLKASSLEAAGRVRLHTGARGRLLDWMIAFTKQHAQHVGELKSLPVLRTILY